MAERVHPVVNSPPRPDDSEQQLALTTTSKPSSPPPNGTYVIQVPKDTIYRIPPPENAYRYKAYTSRKSPRSRCCCCFGYLLSILLLVLLLAGISAGVFYLIVRPKALSYSVEKISVTGFNLSEPSMSPEFDVTVKSENPNNKISVYYNKGSWVKLYHEDIKLCDGVLPVFYQPNNNVTIFEAALKGKGIVLGSAAHDVIVTEQNQKNIPLKLKMKVPVKIKVGSVKTWEITVKVSCDVTLDKLTAESKIVNKDCNIGVRLW